MSKQTEKSGKAKTKKHMKVSKKNRIIATIVIIVLVLLCFSYFAYVTGLPAKILPGAKIVHTVDGKEKTVDHIGLNSFPIFEWTTISYQASIKDIKTQICLQYL